MKHENQQPKIFIPSFVFTDGSTGPFLGYDRESRVPSDCAPKWLWEMSVYDAGGNYFAIDIDTRKKSQSKEVTFILDGKAYYHPITRFATWGAQLNPENAHCLPHLGCSECEDFRIKQKAIAGNYECPKCQVVVNRGETEWRSEGLLPGVWVGKCPACKQEIYEARIIVPDAGDGEDLIDTYFFDDDSSGTTH